MHLAVAVQIGVQCDRRVLKAVRTCVGFGPRHHPGVSSHRVRTSNPRGTSNTRQPNGSGSSSGGTTKQLEEVLDADVVVICVAGVSRRAGKRQRGTPDGRRARTVEIAEADHNEVLQRAADVRGLRDRQVLGWPKRCKLARAFLWEHSYKWLKLAQLLG